MSTGSSAVMAPAHSHVYQHEQTAPKQTNDATVDMLGGSKTASHPGMLVFPAATYRLFMLLIELEL